MGVLLLLFGPLLLVACATAEAPEQPEAITLGMGTTDGSCGTSLCCSNCPAIPVLRVIDGDTFSTTGDQSVRLFGIDTPERGEACYREAMARLRELAGSEVRVELGPPEIARVREVLALAASEGHPLFPCLHLISYTGLRRGEALGLRYQDLNLETGMISIVQTVSRTHEKGIIIQPTKNGSSRRTVDLDDVTIEVLRAHIGRQMLTRMDLEGSYEDHGLVFPGPLGKPLEPITLNRALKSFARRVGLENAKIHHLRHFHASVMLQKGGSLLLVSKRLGHASIATTGDIYGHLLPGWQKEAANAFAKAMKEG